MKKTISLILATVILLLCASSCTVSNKTVTVTPPVSFSDTPNYENTLSLISYDEDKIFRWNKAPWHIGFDELELYLPASYELTSTDNSAAPAIFYSFDGDFSFGGIKPSVSMSFYNDYFEQIAFEVNCFDYDSPYKNEDIEKAFDDAYKIIKEKLGKETAKIEADKNVSAPMTTYLWKASKIDDKLPQISLSYMVATGSSAMLVIEYK